MLKLYLKLTLTVIAFLITCSSPDNILGPAPSGQYVYSSFDSTGKMIVKGWLILRFDDTNEISGKWNFYPVGHPEDIGPQTGNGKLKGGTFHDMVWIELNPQFSDNNLRLSGNIVDGIFAGRWTWITYSGPTNHGSFKAERY